MQAIPCKRYHVRYGYAGSGSVSIDGDDTSDMGELIVGSLAMAGNITLRDVSLLEIGTTACGRNFGVRLYGGSKRSNP